MIIPDSKQSFQLIRTVAHTFCGDFDNFPKGLERRFWAEGSLLVMGDTSLAEVVLWSHPPRQCCCPVVSNTCTMPHAHLHTQYHPFSQKHNCATVLYYCLNTVLLLSSVLVPHTFVHNSPDQVQGQQSTDKRRVTGQTWTHPSLLSSPGSSEVEGDFGQTHTHRWEHIPNQEHTHTYTQESRRT